MNQELGSINIKVRLVHEDHDMPEEEFMALCKLVDQTMEMIEQSATGILSHSLWDKAYFGVHNEVSCNVTFHNPSKYGLQEIG